MRYASSPSMSRPHITSPRSQPSPQSLSKLPYDCVSCFPRSLATSSIAFQARYSCSLVTILAAGSRPEATGPLPSALNMIAVRAASSCSPTLLDSPSA
eukprot:6109891-Prymnesium_polylepis.1